MPARYTLRRFLTVASTCLLAVATTLVVATLGSTHRASAAAVTTAWGSGAFSVNTSGVVSRADIVLGRPNTVDSHSLALGHASPGVAPCAAKRVTARTH